VSSEPRRDDGPSHRRRPTGNFADGLRAMRGMPRVVWVLGLASLLNDVSSEAIFPLLPLFLTSLGAPMGFIGLIEGSADALGSILKVVAGRLSDRGPRKLVRRRRLHDPGACPRGHLGGDGALARVRRASARPHRQGHSLGPARRDDRGIGPPSQRGRAFGVNRSMDHFGARWDRCSRARCSGPASICPRCS
jgi:hypothetical protein